MKRCYSPYYFDALIKGVYNKIHKYNKNWLCAIVGKTGSGKSYASLEMARRIYPDFQIKNVCWSIEQFMERINENPKRGEVLIMEEAGVNVSSRDWQQVTHKLFGFVAQSFRELNLACIFNMPRFDFVEKQWRNLFHTCIECLAINSIKKVCNVKWMNDPYWEGMTNHVRGTFPRIKLPNGRIYLIQKIEIPKPPEYLIEPYEEAKHQFLKTLNKDVLGTVKGIKNQVEKGDRLDPDAIKELKDEILHNFDKFGKRFPNGKVILDAKLIQFHLNVPSLEAHVIKKELENELKVGFNE